MGNCRFDGRPMLSSVGCCRRVSGKTRHEHHERKPDPFHRSVHMLAYDTIASGNSLEDAPTQSAAGRIPVVREVARVSC